MRNSVSSDQYEYRSKSVGSIAHGTLGNTRSTCVNPLVFVSTDHRHRTLPFVQKNRWCLIERSSALANNLKASHREGYYTKKKRTNRSFQLDFRNSSNEPGLPPVTALIFGPLHEGIATFVDSWRRIPTPLPRCRIHSPPRFPRFGCLGFPKPLDAGAGQVEVTGLVDVTEEP